MGPKCSLSVVRVLTILNEESICQFVISMFVSACGWVSEWMGGKQYRESNTKLLVQLHCPPAQIKPFDVR